MSMQNGPSPLALLLDTLTAEAARVDVEGVGAAFDQAAHARFQRYYDLLLEWNERAGLTTVTDPVEVARRHFGESLALYAVLRRAHILWSHARVIDLGTGAGFPGLPLAILDTSLDVALLETHGRRAEFLRTAVEALELEHVRVVHARAEDAARDPDLRETFDLVIARALAAMPVLVELALPFLKLGGVLATPKGARALEELSAAQAAIEALGGTAEAPLPLPLPTDAPPQLVLVVRRTSPLDSRYPRRPGIPAKRPLGARPETGARMDPSPP